MRNVQFNRRSVFCKAWAVAKSRARDAYRNGSGANLRYFFRFALKEAWADQKALVTKIRESNARVLAEVERIKAMNTPEAKARRAAELAGWEARCGMPQRDFSRGFYV